MTSAWSSSKQLIIQLARFGDLLQLAPLTAELGIGSDLHLLVDSSLEATARLLPNVQKIIAIPRSEALKLVLKGDFSGGFTFWNDVAVSLQSERYDRVINVTHTPESGLIARLTGCNDLRGATYDRKGIASPDPWEKLFRTTLVRRDWSGFHLVDYHRLSAGCAVDCGSPTFNFQLSTFNSNRIALQLGANSPLRRWPVESFAQLAQAIHHVSPVHFVLLGSAEEAPLAAEFLHLTGLPAVDLTGKTTPAQLAEAVRESDLLVSGDTGTIHLAALIGTQAVGIHLGMARPDDTAPYQNGAVIFEPRTHCYPCGEQNVCGHLACHSDVPIEAVAEAVLDLISGRKIIPEDAPSFRRRVVAFDENGLLTLQGAAETASDHRRAAMRCLWLSEFAGVSSGLDLRRERSEASVTQLATLSTEASLKANKFSDGLKKGSPDRNLLKSVQESISQIESLASTPDLTGLLAQMFSLELERPPSDPLGAIRLIETSLTSLSRRSQSYISGFTLNSQLSTLN